MGKTYKRLGNSWGERNVSGYRRSRRNHDDIRPGARVPHPWLSPPYCDLCHLPYRIARALHKKGWDSEKIRRHLRWKFKLSQREVENMYFWWER